MVLKNVWYILHGYGVISPMYQIIGWCFVAVGSICYAMSSLAHFSIERIECKFQMQTESAKSSVHQLVFERGSLFSTVSERRLPVTVSPV
jgi:hypothetical protein